MTFGDSSSASADDSDSDLGFEGTSFRQETKKVMVLAPSHTYTHPASNTFIPRQPVPPVSGHFLEKVTRDTSRKRAELEEEVARLTTLVAARKHKITVREVDFSHIASDVITNKNLEEDAQQDKSTAIIINTTDMRLVPYLFESIQSEFVDSAQNGNGAIEPGNVLHVLPGYLTEMAALQIDFVQLQVWRVL